MDKWINFGLSLICVTLPEGIFLTILSYILLKRRDLIDIYRIKFTLKNILIPVIPTIIILDFLNWIVKSPKGINSIISLGILFVTIKYIINKNNFEFISRMNLKIISSITRSFIVFCMLELFYAPVLTALTGKDFNDFHSNIILYILTSLPSLIIQFTILFVILLKKQTIRKLQILQLIFKNKYLLWFTTIASILIIIIYFILAKLIFWDDILKIFTLANQIFYISIFVYFIPCFIFLCTYITIIHGIDFEKRVQQIYQNTNNTDI